MTSCAHTERRSAAPGFERGVSMIDRLRTARRRFDGARGLAALLLGAVVSALLVVADRVVANLTDGDLLVAWAAAWALAFATLALLADSARAVARRAWAWGARGARRSAQRRADALFLAAARSDPRMLQELNAALTRHEVSEAQPGCVSPVRAAAGAAPDAQAPVQVPKLFAHGVRAAYYL